MNITITEWLRLKGVWWMVLSSRPSTQAGHLEQPAQDCAQAAFESLQGWRLHNLSGQPVPVLGPTELDSLPLQVAISSGPFGSFLAAAALAALQVCGEILLHQKTWQLYI